VTAAIDRLFSDWEGRPGGAVTVLHEGTTVHHAAYGLADLQEARPFATDQLFAIASVTKQFVAFLVLLLESQGALGRNDEVHRHLPELGDLGAEVTIEHLLRHTSGIRDYITLATFAGGRLLEGLDRESIRALLLAQRSLDFPPGSAAVYSNSNYVLLSWVIERVTGRSLPDALATWVFEPLGMSSTIVLEDPTRAPPGSVVGYAGPSPAGFRRWQWSMHMSGEGGIWSTLDDLARWLRHIDEPVIGSRQLLDTMMQSRPLVGGGSTDYLIGLRENGVLGERWVGHSGGWEGYRSQTLWFPTRRLGVAVIANQTIDPTGAALEVADLFLPPPPAELAGTYRSDELDGTWVVDVEDGAVLVSATGPFGRQVRLPLRRTGTDVFVPTRMTRDAWDLEFDTTIAFHRDGDGTYRHLTVGAGIVRTVRFDRLD
jgi:CubicO group peptidase (beta-lactamase class C family)